MSKISRQSRRAKGFTLIEAVIVVAVLASLLLIGVPAFLGTLNRTRLTGSSRQLASLMQLARLDAIKYGMPAKVVYDANLRRFSGFLDFDRDGVQDPTEKVLSGSVDLSRKVLFQGPGDSAENDANAIDLWDDNASIMGPSFQTDGSVDQRGAFRIADGNGNFIEVRIDTTATGKVILRKYDPVADAFYYYLENGKKWEWY